MITPTASSTTDQSPISMSFDIETRILLPSLMSPPVSPIFAEDPGTLRGMLSRLCYVTVTKEEKNNDA